MRSEQISFKAFFIPNNLEEINNSSRNFWFLKSRSFNLCDYLMIFLWEIIWDFIVIGSTYFLKYKTKPSNIFFWEILCESEGYINIFLEIYFDILNINSINSALFNFPNIDFAFWLFVSSNSVGATESMTSFSFDQ